MTANEFDAQRWGKGDSVTLDNGMVCDVNGVNFYKRIVYAYNRELNKCFSYGFEEVVSHNQDSGESHSGVEISETIKMLDAVGAAIQRYKETLSK